jgi:hypothetical protein
MLYREIIVVCSEIHTKHINTLCGQNVELLNVKLVVHIVTTMIYKADMFIAYLGFTDNLKAILQIWPTNFFPQSGPVSFHSKPYIHLPFLPTWQCPLGPKHVFDMTQIKLIFVFDLNHRDSFILKILGSSETSINIYRFTIFFLSNKNPRICIP